MRTSLLFALTLAVYFATSHDSGASVGSYDATVAYQPSELNKLERTAHAR